MRSWTLVYIFCSLSPVFLCGVLFFCFLLFYESRKFSVLFAVCMCVCCMLICLRLFSFFYFEQRSSDCFVSSACWLNYGIFNLVLLLSPSHTFSSSSSFGSVLFFFFSTSCYFSHCSTHLWVVPLLSFAGVFVFRSV